MRDNPFTIIGAKPFPCAGCKCECCTGVPVAEDELVDIVKELAALPADELRRLAGQRRDALQCMFVDTEKWRCSVYRARPFICRLFGRVPKMPCSYAPGRAAEVSEAESDGQVFAYIMSGKFVGVTGINLVRDGPKHRLTWAEVLELVQVLDRKQALTQR